MGLPRSWELGISSHALRTEGDVFHILLGDVKANFYPRPPYGGRPLLALEHGVVLDISIHALRTEGDGN